jgi:Holliday junction resolvasome RuvABC endonuclease subunit
MLNAHFTTEPLRILALDPGTNTLGVAWIELCLVSGRITLVYGGTFSADRYADFDSSLQWSIGQRAIKLDYHRQNLQQLLFQYQPHVVASEAPFMGRFPQAYAALVECCNVITHTVLGYDPSLQVQFVDPPTAKLSVGALTRKGSKENVQESIRALVDAGRLFIHPSVPFLELDEHTYDAIAVGYWSATTFALQLRR